MSVVNLPIELERVQIADGTLERVQRIAGESTQQDEIFTFSGMCSNNRLDSYFTRMDPATTLRNYAEDLKTGVSLINGHDTSEIPYGRSFGGEVVESGESTNVTEIGVRGEWYIVRDLELTHNANNLIRGIERGIIRDMSVGFGGANMSYRCGSCNKSLYDPECTHIPGLEDEHGRIAFAWIDNAHLREVSTVYKGATPGAYIDKAREYIQQGELANERIDKLENRYNTRFERKDGTSIFLPSKQTVTGGNDNMNLKEEIRKALAEGTLDRSEALNLLNEGNTYRHQEDVQLRNELGDKATIDGVRELKAEAEHGRQYIADLIDKAVETKVRAKGEDFDGEKYKARLVRFNDVEMIKEEIETWEEVVQEKFQGGRQTKKEDVNKRHEGNPGDEDDVIVSEHYKEAE
jgi:hypothetical protein